MLPTKNNYHLPPTTTTYHRQLQPSTVTNSYNHHQLTDFFQFSNGDDDSLSNKNACLLLLLLERINVTSWLWRAMLSTWNFNWLQNREDVLNCTCFLLNYSCKWNPTTLCSFQVIGSFININWIQIMNNYVTTKLITNVVIVNSYVDHQQ